MKKVGIITLTGNKNYGNKLQNYALNRIIKEYGFDTYTIWCNESHITYILKKIKNILLSAFDIESKRKRKFVKFNDKYLNNYYVNQNSLESLNKTFSYYAVGSDQIWNPNIINRYLGTKILGIGKKIFSYAASVGVSEIDNDYKKLISDKFTYENIKYISVREKEAQSIIRENTGRDDVEVLIDPTLLFDSNEWDEIARPPRNGVPEKYVLLYFLGGVSDSKKEAINRFAEKNNCQIINLLDKKGKYYTADPSEFLYLEKNATLVCTDSFHSCVFALIYNRPFIIFDREHSEQENMSSRLTNFIEMFDIKDRGFNNHEITSNNLQYDYTNAYKILETEKSKSKEFLERALNIQK